MGNQGNGIASAIFKSIFIILGIYVVAVNITLWATSKEVGNIQMVEFVYGNHYVEQFEHYHGTRMSDFGMVGFEKFFDYLSTFPGLKFTQGVTDTYLNIVDGYSITGIGLIDALLGIVRIISAPFLLTMTIIADIIHNAIWFLEVLTIIPEPIGTHV